MGYGLSNVFNIIDLWQTNVSAPRIIFKCILSLTTFGVGTVTMMQTDKLFQRMAIRTSLVKNIEESLLTICWAFFSLFIQVTHFCILTLFTWLGLFSWSWTNESVAPIYHLFLLPWIPTPCMITIQYFLYQKSETAKLCFSQFDCSCENLPHQSQGRFIYLLLTFHSEYLYKLIGIFPVIGSCSVQPSCGARWKIGVIWSRTFLCVLAWSMSTFVLAFYLSSFPLFFDVLAPCPIS